MPGRYIAAGLYSEVVVNRGSTVIPKPYYTVEIEVTGGIVVRYIVYKLVGSYRTSYST